MSCCLAERHAVPFAQLRQQRETIEGLVDDVVECYHNGFAKAIHNYSQILQLFSDSKAHVRCSSSAAARTPKTHTLLQDGCRSQDRSELQIDEVLSPRA